MLLSHFIASRNESGLGYTFTLPSRLGEMLEEVEEIYGPRDAAWAILGVEFGPRESPQTWYPGNCNHVLVQLTHHAHDCEAWACYQLAHECVHLLAPSGITKDAPVLEEGLAVVYSEDYVARTFPDWHCSRATSAYTDAAAKVRQLLTLDANAIRAIRVIQPAFHKMTAQTFHSAGISAPPELIEALIAPFDYAST